jgi:hypothetical protein
VIEVVLLLDGVVRLDGRGRDLQGVGEDLLAVLDLLSLILE